LQGRGRATSTACRRDFERFVNERYRSELGKRPLTVMIRPTTRVWFNNFELVTAEKIGVGWCEIPPK
jgi:hypothetical protein